jgi:uncharacterized protein YktA (UPF0223 family)
MNKITEKQLKELAEHLSCRETCYLNKKTGEILSIPQDILDDLHPYLDEDSPVMKELRLIKEQPENYLVFEPMRSNESYRVMVDFLDEIPPGELYDRIVDALEKNRPFRQFKDIVEGSAYRKRWFAFLHEKNVEYARSMLLGYSDGC